MGALQFVLFLGVAALVTACGLSSTPTRALSGAANDAVATAQRDALGLGDIATYNTTNLPIISADGFDTSGNLNADGYVTLGVLGVNGAALNTEKFGVAGNSLFQGDVGITGDFSVATDKFVVTALNGNTALSGDLRVNTDKFVVTASNGNTALKGDLTVNTDKFVVTASNGNTALKGDLTVNTDKFVVTASNGDTAIAGSLTVGGNSVATSSDLALKAPLDGPAFTGTVSINNNEPFQSAGDLVFGGTEDRKLWCSRETGNNPGNDLTIQAGGAAAGATDAAGGTLILGSGISTGNQGSQIEFYTASKGAAGTGDRNPSLKMTLTDTGLLSFAAGGGLKIDKTGSDNRMGEATLVLGTVTVNTSAAKTSSTIFLTIQDPNGGAVGTPYISSKGAGTFTITSTSATDTSKVAWLIID